MFFLDAGVQETDIGNAVDHNFAVQLQQQAQDAVRAGMLRPHVQQHRLARRPFRNQVFDLVETRSRNSCVPLLRGYYVGHQSSLQC